jgi:hypothetical protein
MERDGVDGNDVVKANLVVLQRDSSCNTTFRRNSTLLPLHIAEITQTVDHQLLILFRKSLALYIRTDRVGLQVSRSKQSTYSRTVHISIPTTKSM